MFVTRHVFHSHSKNSGIDESNQDAPGSDQIPPEYLQLCGSLDRLVDAKDENRHGQRHETRPTTGTTARAAVRRQEIDDNVNDHDGDDGSAMDVSAIRKALYYEFELENSILLLGGEAW